MNRKSFKERLHRLQSGQALVEYWPTIPVAIAIMVGASILVGAVGNAFLKTANGLEGYCKPETEQEVETVANIFNHTIEASARVYDPNTNRTTIAFTVTSGSQPSISHWILGVPKGVADHVISTSEAWEWVDSDPTTGMAGMKFDTGYESTDPTDGNDGGNNKGGKKNASIRQPIYAKTLSPVMAAAFFELETRVISITLDGNYQFGAVTVTTKAGSDQVGSSTVNGPIAPAGDDNNNQNNDGGVDRSKGC
ncbi:MAG: hypothetical protein H6672_06705 [Anaerolineaceae bacterium]|nr:hypothetical protein [Anaerolineaceae bacterium]